MCQCLQCLYLKLNLYQNLIYYNQNIDYVVFGVDNISQLQEDIEIIKQNINCEECIKDLKSQFVNIEKNIIFPSLWKK